MTCVLSPTGLIPWFSKTEGNTYATLLHHPFLFKGKPTHAEEVAPLCCIIPSSLGKYRRSFKPHQKEFLAPLLGRIFNIYQVPNHKSHLLSIYIICHLPLVFLSPTSQKIAVLFASLFPFAVFLSDLSFACNHE